MVRQILVLAAGAVTAIAQPGSFEVRVPPPGATEAAVRAHTIEFVQGEFGFGGQVVKNAPYTAEATTESVQVLGDGNRITRKSSAQLARDSEGRTRRDATLAAVGPLAGAEAPKTSFIHDPVTNISVTLDHDTKTARKMKGRGFMIERSATGPAVAAGRTEVREDVLMARPVEAGVRGPGPEGLIVGHAPTMVRMRTSQQGAKQESLGKRNIEGVMAEGTRIVDVIPAGAIGNERPIEIVSERWFSPELQTLVMSTFKDPMSGETTYKLTNIQRGEPAKSLFEAPPDYVVKEADAPNIRFMREKIEKAKE